MTNTKSHLLNHLTALLTFARGPDNINVQLRETWQRLKQRLVDTCRVCETHGCLDCHCEPATMERGF